MASKLIGKQNPSFKHGLTKHPLFLVWQNMKTRCLNTNVKAYKNYGGRGITIWPYWYGFQTFYNWCIKNGWKPGLTLDREENDGNYEPKNCRFVDRTTQARNQRLMATSITGKKGVATRNDSKTFRVRITVDKKTIYLGNVKTVEEGEHLRKEYIKKHNLKNFV